MTILIFCHYEYLFQSQLYKSESWQSRYWHNEISIRPKLQICISRTDAQESYVGESNGIGVLEWILPYPEF